MKRHFLFFIIIAAFSASAGAVVIPTVNLEELCPAYQRGEFSQSQVNDLRHDGVNLSVACQPFEAKRGADRFAANMMSQFYGVKESSVRIESTFRDKPEGIVRVSDQEGNACSFDVAQAPNGVDAPYGWLMANADCKPAHQAN